MPDPIICRGCGAKLADEPVGIITHDCPKKCVKCGHGACPFCGDWCDTLLDGEDLCCEGECTYPGDHDGP